MATAAYPANRMEAGAKVRLTADGRAVASSGTHEIGNGAYTIMARIAADALGLAAERVRFELGDTILPFAPAAGGSWSTASVGPAIIAAAEAVKAKVVRMAVADRASPLFGVAADQVVCRDGALVHGKEEGKRDAVADVLRRAGKKEVEAEASAGPGEEKKKFSFLSFGAHFVEVKVDPDLPAVRVTRVVSAFDPGAVLNPKAARSQMLGGITMGLGAALLEHTVYDPRTGAVVNPDLADYLLPVSADVPAIDVAFVNEPDLHFNPTGGRGLGELGVPGVAAAVANAAFHATGKRVRDLPVTPDKIL
jgi:xanthine dehydrogenase YagR molybdenum-binding subunit